MMKLIEIVKGLATSEDTREKIIALCEAIGKTPVDVEEAPDSW